MLWFFTLIRSYVQMCKRCITFSYDSLFAQKLESRITHVFHYSLQLQEIAFRKFSLQLMFFTFLPTQHPVRMALLLTFLKIPTHLRFSLNYVCMHVVNGDGSFRQIHSNLTAVASASTPPGNPPSCYY